MRASILLSPLLLLSLACGSSSPLLLSAPAALEGYTQESSELALHVEGGEPPYGYALESGALPGGLALGATDGRITGTATQAGAFPLTVRVTDASGASQAVSFTLQIWDALDLQPRTLPGAVVGQAYDATVQAVGGKAPLTVRLDGAAPGHGLTLDGGHLVGTPTDPGELRFGLTVSDANGRTFGASFTLEVEGGLVVAPAVLTDAYTGVAYTQAFSADGAVAPLSWQITQGALPAGLTLSSDGALAGTASATGTFHFTVSVQDGAGVTASQALTLEVYRPPSLDTTALAEGFLGVGYSQPLVTSGGKPPLTVKRVSGTLPAGLTLDDGTVAGTPSEAVTRTLTFKVEDANLRSSQHSYTLVIHDGLAVTTASLADAYVGSAYSATLSAGGGTAPLTWTVISGATPAGTSLSSSGILSGTPTTAGTASFTVKVQDAASKTGTRDLSVDVYAPPQIATSTLPDGTQGQGYTAQLTATGGKGTRTFSLSSGALPSGLSLSSAGALSGTPTAVGTSSFTVKVQDQNGKSTQRSLALTVNVSTGDPVILKVGSWNTEWFGDPGNGPSDDLLQEENVRDAMLAANLDLWGLAELVNQSRFDTLLSELPGYAGFMANASNVTDGASYYSSSEQKVGIVYKADRFTVTDAQVIAGCNYDFAGRPPLEVSLTYHQDGVTQPFHLIVLHAKAYDDLSSYGERYDGANCLKPYLDELSGGPVLVVGDWNDDIDQSITAYVPGDCVEAGSSGYCQSPYQVLVNDSADYNFLTAPLSAAGEHSTVGFAEMIDHHLANTAMAAFHVSGSTQVLHPSIANYGSTTSDHYPVESDFNLGAPIPPPQVILNEVRYTELTGNYGSEFVEVLNTGTSSVDLSGWTISDSSQVRHTFESGTVLGAGKAIVVFGDAASIPVGLTNAVASSTATLSLHPSDSVALRDASGTLVDSHSWTADFATPGMSANRAIDGDGSAAFVAHTSVEPGVIASPGTRADGTDF